MPPTRPAAALTCLLCVTCATPPSPRAEATCSSYLEVDRAWREAEASAGARLLEVSESASAARRACARHLLGTIPLRFEAPTAQLTAELAAMVKTFGVAGTRQLASDVLGPEARALDPLILEGAATAPLEPPSFVNEPPPPGACSAAPPCERVGCVLEENPAPGPVELAARACVDDLSVRHPPDEAEVLAALLPRLRAAGALGAATEVLARLEVIRQQRWPDIQALARAGRLSAAAMKARPFEVLPLGMHEAKRLTDSAVAFHLDVASRAPAGAAWLHRAIAAALSGKPVERLELRSGRWLPAAWTCQTAVPPTPAAPPGLTLRLVGQCESATEERSELKTFDYEAGLINPIAAFLEVTCGGGQLRVPVKLTQLELEVGDDRGAHAVELAVDLARQRCAPSAAARRLCEDLAAARSRLTTEDGAVELYRGSGAWPPCFESYLATEYGVSELATKKNPPASRSPRGP